MSLTKLSRIEAAVAMAGFRPAALRPPERPHDAHVERGPMHLLTRPKWSSRPHAGSLATTLCVIQVSLGSESLVPGGLI